MPARQPWQHGGNWHRRCHVWLLASTLVTGGAG